MDEDIYASFWDHIDQLRLVLLKIGAVIFVGMLAAFVFHVPLITWLTASVALPLVLLGPLEGICVAVKISFWVGLVATSPCWLFFLFQFINPALKGEERCLVLPFIMVSLLLMAFGAFFAFAVTIPMANVFFLSFNESLGQNLWSLAQYLDYTFFLLLANALAFELTVIGFFAVHGGFISAHWLVSKRRVAIVCLFVLAAVLTPPDVVTQLLLAFPLIILYEGLVIYAKFRYRPL